MRRVDLGAVRDRWEELVTACRAGVPLADDLLRLQAAAADVEELVAEVHQLRARLAGPHVNADQAKRLALVAWIQVWAPWVPVRPDGGPVAAWISWACPVCGGPRDAEA